jgi:hypothetical protein
MIKKAIIALGTILILVLVIVYCLHVKRNYAPRKLANIPTPATWIGGADGGTWFLIDKVVSNDAFRIKLYNDNNGELITNSIFLLNNGCSLKEIDSIHLLNYIEGYDGREILLNVPSAGGKTCFLAPQ